MATPLSPCRQGRNLIPCYDSPAKVSPSSGAKSGAIRISVCVHIPEQLSAEERALYECLRTHNEKKT
jgi:hypothetical protein